MIRKAAFVFSLVFSLVFSIIFAVVFSIVFSLVFNIVLDRTEQDDLEPDHVGVLSESRPGDHPEHPAGLAASLFPVSGTARSRQNLPPPLTPRRGRW